MRTFVKAVLASSALASAACGGSSPVGPGKTLTITGLTWVEENIDPSFWTTPPASPPQTAFYDFWIRYTGDIAFGDIQYARIYLPGGNYWNLVATSAHLDATNHTIGGWGRWYSSQHQNFLPIGPLQVEVKLNDGVDAKYTATIPAPGSTTAGAYAWMHPPEEVPSPPSDSAPMIGRATLGPTQTFTAATQTLTITFSVVDPNVYNGFVWLYDASLKYLGGFFYLRDGATGAASPRLAGSTLYTDGTTNVLTLSAADVQLEAGATLGQIASLRVGLTDGAQYGPQPDGTPRRDCRSISEARPFTMQ